MKNPLVSILMPAYNHAKYIRQAIDSAVNQTYENIEIIISDNASTDGTTEIIKSYTDKRIRANFFSENHGIVVNGQYCLEQAQGEYLGCLFTDDYWDVTKIEKQVAVFEKNKELGAVFTHAQIRNDDGGIEGLDNHPLKQVFIQPNRTQAQWLRHFFYFENCLCAPSALIITEDYKKILINGISHGLRQLSDFSAWIQLVKQKPIHIIQEDLTYHRVRNDFGNMSASTRENAVRHINEMKMILQEFFDDMPEDLFLSAFSGDFVKKGSLTAEELCCEKVFLFRMRHIPIFCEKIYDLLKDPALRNVLKTVYNFSFDRFYELTASYVCIDVQTSGAR